MRGRDGKLYTRREKKQDGPLPNSKFSASDIRAIRAEHSATVPQPSLAQLGRKYGVSAVCIGNIVNRKVFADIDGTGEGPSADAACTRATRRLPPRGPSPRS